MRYCNNRSKCKGYNTAFIQRLHHLHSKSFSNDRKAIIAAHFEEAEGKHTKTVEIL